MKKLLLSGATALVLISTSSAAFACYKQNAKYSDGSVGIKCSNGKQTTIYNLSGYQIGGTGYKYSSLAAAAKAACGCQRGMLRTLIVFAGLIASSGSAWAQSNVWPPNECALIVASRSSIPEARDYVSNLSDTRFAKVYEASNGWYAISIGTLKPHEVDPVLKRWKASGKIPGDAYCSHGKKYVGVVDLDYGTIKPIVRQASSSQGSACSNPMGNEQLHRVITEFERMTPGGDGFKIDRCRNITIQYADKRKTGKLHQLFTRLNGSHHDTTYLGLMDDDTWWFSGSKGQVYIYHPDKTKQQSADWMVDKNSSIVRLLKLAGYESDPRADKRAEILKSDLEKLGTPDFGQSVGSLLNIIGRYSPSGDQTTNANQCSNDKRICVSQCEGLPKGKGVYAGFGPYGKCKSQCRAISCR